MRPTMSQYPSCSCAVLLTDEALEAQLKEIELAEERVVARVEIRKGHSTTNDIDDWSDSEDESAYISASQSPPPPQKHHRCPFPGCERMKRPFGSRARLQRHYERHVRCVEVCVCGHLGARCARALLRHAAAAHGRGRVRDLCAEVRAGVAAELEGAEEALWLGGGGGRARGVAEDDGFVLVEALGVGGAGGEAGLDADDGAGLCSI